MSNVGKKNQNGGSKIITATQEHTAHTYQEILQVATSIPGEGNRRGVRVLFDGLPGQAKTAVIEAYAKAQGFYLKKLLLSQLEASDITGVTCLREVALGLKLTDYAPQRWAWEANQSPKSIIFLDEFGQGKEDVQASALTMLTHGTVGNYELHPDVCFLGAMNPPEKVGGYPLSSAMSSRWTHINWEGLPFAAWAQYMEQQPKWYTAQKQEQTPVGTEEKTFQQEWEKTFPLTVSEMMGYLYVNQEARYDYPREGSPESQKGWPCDRQWSVAARILAGCRVLKASHETKKLMLQGTIGEGATTSFLRWQRELSLPSPEDVMDRGNWFPNPSRPDITYVVVRNCVTVLTAGKDMHQPSQPKALLQRAGRLWDVLAACVEAGQQDLVAGPSNTLMLQQLYDGESRSYVKVFAALGRIDMEVKKEAKK